MNILSRLLFLIFTFSAFYVLPIHKDVYVLYILSFFSFLYLIYAKTEIFHIYRTIITKKFLYLVALAPLYAIVVVLINSIFANEVPLYVYIKNALRPLWVLILSLSIVFFMIIFTQRNMISLHDIIKLLILVGTIQSLCVISSLVFPEIRGHFINFLTSNDPTSRQSILLLNASHLLVYRAYGFAGDLFESFGYVSSFLFILCFYYMLSCNISFVIPLPLLLLPAIINSRSSIIMLIIGTFLISFASLLTKNRVKWLLSITFIISSCLILFIILLANNTQYTDWVKEGLQSLLSFLIGKEEQITGSIKVLTSSNFWFFPSGIDVILGTGYSTIDFHLAHFGQSDIGYVNTIWIYGIIGTMMIYVPYLYLFTRGYKNARGYLQKSLIAYIAISFFLINIKTTILGLSPIPIIVYYIVLLFIKANHGKL